MALVAALAVAGSVFRTVRLDETVAADRPGMEAVAARVALFERILEALPEHRQIGFFSSTPGASDDADFFLAQYVLAPRRILRGRDYPLVLGWFATEAERNAFIMSGELELVRGISRHLALFHGSHGSQR